jgi:hypothetical protein
LRGSVPKKNPAFVFPNPTDLVVLLIASEKLKYVGLTSR